MKLAFYLHKVHKFQGYQTEHIVVWETIFLNVGGLWKFYTIMLTNNDVTPILKCHQQYK